MQIILFASLCSVWCRSHNLQKKHKKETFSRYKRAWKSSGVANDSIARAPAFLQWIIKLLHNCSRLHFRHENGPLEALRTKRISTCFPLRRNCESIIWVERWAWSRSTIIADSAPSLKIYNKLYLILSKLAHWSCKMKMNDAPWTYMKTKKMHVACSAARKCFHYSIMRICISTTIYHTNWCLMARSVGIVLSVKPASHLILLIKYTFAEASSVRTTNRRNERQKFVSKIKMNNRKKEEKFILTPT